MLKMKKLGFKIEFRILKWKYNLGKFLAHQIWKNINLTKKLNYLKS